MKMIELKPVYEAFEQDFSAQAGSRWSDQELELAFQAVRKAEMSKEEITDTARDMTEKDGFDRTVAGAEFALNRMHILIHGMAPQGETESRAEKMFGIPDTMMKFANKKGYDTASNIKKARVDLKGRPVRRKEAEAKKLMSEYYMANKANLPKDIVKHREAIISDLMAGLSPEEAFGRYMNESVTLDTMSAEDMSKVMDFADKQGVQVLGKMGPKIELDLDRDSLKASTFISHLRRSADFDDVSEIKRKPGFDD